MRELLNNARINKINFFILKIFLFTLKKVTVGARKKVLAPKKFVQPIPAILKGNEEKQQNTMAQKWLVQLRPYHKLGLVYATF